MEAISSFPILSISICRESDKFEQGKKSETSKSNKNI